ncbi:salt tolerance down-regulator-domain-containing protein [Naematelia encephala]|uniref:Stress response protein NST1 n=1 Tax=Naematelia encephala TaxID=71784 RepID=A0A1Y2AS11_9TREE|nr:salt tolerance down-regulator-domain-containing protein [Naematelia encephala]
MSAPPVSQATSRSAAKKKAKKAAKATQVTEPAQSGESDPLDPNFLPSFPPGAYPVEYAYNSATYYDDGEVVTANGTTNAPFSLPFPFTYPPALQQQQQLPNGVGGAGAVPNNINHEDLIRVANELYKRMGDPNFAADDQYWTSLPAHLRHFIRDVLPTENNKPSEAPRSLYSMAQQIVNAASQGMGLGPGVGQNLMAQMNGRQHYPPQSIGEELGFRPHPNARDDELDDEDDFDLDGPEYAQPNGEAPKKKNKKKKKKSAAALDPPPLPPPAIKQPPRQPVPPQPLHQPALNPPPPPAAPVPAHPPSSRAAGKQPMTTNPAPTANPPARSARAAGKAPASSTPVHNHAHHNHAPPAKPAAKGKAPANPPPTKIWTQSSKQDRENIRQFWLGLNEAERRDLLQIEKDAVLRKMKEQHRNSCGCAVCGRKKVNIEMELDQLYEQYYDELRTYAAEQRAAERGHPPPEGAGPFPGSVEVDASGQITQYDHRAPDPHDHDDLIDDGSEGEYDDEEEYDDEDDLDDEDLGSEDADADELDDAPPPPRPVKPVPKKNLAPRPEGADDFMAFGSNLATIKGGILTVADDLLKNDGAKFLEMMEQLAVARSSREEQNYRDLQEETDEEDEDEPIPEAERVEEGKRMFQIFAARMFEQRVLHAYREKMSTHKQEAFLRELEDEDEAKRIAAEKRAKDAQKKKDKKK